MSFMYMPSKLRVGVAAAFAAAGVVVASFSSLSYAGTLQTGRKSTDPPSPPKGKLGQDLFLAIDHRSLPEVESLLQRGADPNARNGLEFTPIYIAAASHQTDVMEALLKAGAQKDTKGTYGSPLTFAAITGNVPGAQLLLSLGVDVNTLRTDGMSPLMMAANCGATPLVQDLIQRKADLNAQDDSGATALMMSARNGNLDAARALISSGARVDLPDLDGQTPLMQAAMNGQAATVQMLLKAGAKPNAKDRSGRTALLLAASYGDYPEVIRALVKGNANTKAKDLQGRTAAQVAAARGYTDTVSALGGASHGLARPAPRVAVSRSLKLIQASMQQFNEATSCVSCHQEGIGRIATGEAQAAGFHLDPQCQKAQIGRIEGMIQAMKPLHEQAVKNREVEKQLPLIEINEVSDMYSWILNGMLAQNQKPNPASAAMALCLAHQQSADGSWTFSIPRVPLQSSFFTFTSLAVRALETYAPKTHEAEIQDRIARARDWLVRTTPRSSEDRASRLLGLTWSGADASTRRRATGEILADQRSDGGWSQIPGQQSDAYATGQALYALHRGGGVPVPDPAYQRGVKFLLRTQDEDGSWYVAKRAIPANNYFDAGFPHGESQYSSFNGTCWATLALLPTLGMK